MQSEKGDVAVLPFVGKGTGNNEGDSSAILANISPSEEVLRALWHATGLVEQLLPPSSHFRTAVFVSAQITPAHQLYADCRWLGQELAEMGSDVVSGGGPGGMEAVNAGAMEGRKKQSTIRSVGLSIPLSTEQRANDFLSREYHHKIFFTRLHHFARLGRVFVVMDGGIGTWLELAAIWQLLQRGHLKGTPLILVGDMWPPLMAWMNRYMVARGYVRPEEMEIPLLVPSVHDVIPIVREAHSHFKQLQAAG